jgi:acyl-coenzyme A synthetase/AMP-(fatty) acid ligase
MRFRALPGIPLIQPGDDLPALIAKAAEADGLALADGDVLVVAQKVVSKAEGRIVRLADVTPAPEAVELAERTGRDARLCQLYLDESAAVTEVRGRHVVTLHQARGRPGPRTFAPNLGVALEAWNAAGQPVTGKVGELVVTKPMPSMPLYFWNDPDGARYKDAYFATFPGVWRHGDWMEITERGSVIVSGRSDSTLNRNGVRLGSADIYAVVDRIPQLAESLVSGTELGDGHYWLALFVVLAHPAALTDDLKQAESVKSSET